LSSRESFLYPAMDLVSLPDRPIPEGARVGRITTRDGIGLRWAAWDGLPTRQRRGTVVIVQGRAEFIEKYFDVIEGLRARGLNVIAFDWRGQGGSDRLTRDMGKGHVRRFSDYEIDLDTIMSKVTVEQARPPYFALGHSMGGAVLLRVAKAGWTIFDRMVLSAPMVELEAVPLPGAVRTITGLLRLFGLGTLVVPGGSTKPVAFKPFAGNVVTSDPRAYERTAAFAKADPRLGLGAPTLSWLHEALKVNAAFMHPLYPTDIRTPILIVAAGADRLISTPAVETFARRLQGGSVLTIPGSAHELMMEREIYRAPFFAAFDAFVPGEVTGLSAWTRPSAATKAWLSG